MAEFIADTTPLPYTPEDGIDEDAFISTRQEILERIKPIKHRADDMANALRLRRSNFPTHRPLKMEDVLDAWLNQSYNVGAFGLPCWLNLIKAIADDNGGANRYLATQLAKLYPPGTYSKPTNASAVQTMTKPQQEESSSSDTSGPLTRSVSNTSTTSSRSTGGLNTQISYPITESGGESSFSPTSTTSSGTSSNNSSSTGTTFGTTSSGSTSAGSTSYTSASTVSGTNTSTGGSTMGTVGSSQTVSSNSSGEEESIVILHNRSVHIGGQEYQDSSEQATSVEEGKTTIVPSHSEEPHPHDKSTVADDGKGLFSWGSKQKDKEVNSGDNHSLPPQAKPQEQKNLPYAHPLTPYKMNKKDDHGYALIINNIDIDGRETRKGAEYDSEKLREMLESLGYKLLGDQVYINCTAQRIKSLMEKAMNLDHTHCDSFICCLMSHGDSGYLYGTDDKPVYIETEIHKKVMDCQGLVGKPKIFFIQACRGGTLPEARKVQSDDPGSNQGIILPEACDVFTGYATSPNTKACRFTDEGSWYVTELSKAFKQYPKEDLHTIVQIAHHQVSTDPEYVYEREERDGKKTYRQSPQLVSTLIKKVYFN